MKKRRKKRGQVAEQLADGIALIFDAIFHKPTEAEKLIELAEYTLFPRDEVLMACKHVRPHVLAKVKLAIVFYRANKGLQLRAIMENWNRRRIVKELY